MSAKDRPCGCRPGEFACAVARRLGRGKRNASADLKKATHPTKRLRALRALSAAEEMLVAHLARVGLRGAA